MPIMRVYNWFSSVYILIHIYIINVIEVRLYFTLYEFAFPFIY